MITRGDIVYWRKLATDATPIAAIEGSRDGKEPFIYDALENSEGFEYSVATFDRYADALLFVSASSIIQRLLAEAEAAAPTIAVWLEPDDPEDYEAAASAIEALEGR